MSKLKKAEYFKSCREKIMQWQVHAATIVRHGIEESLKFSSLLSFVLAEFSTLRKSQKTIGKSIYLYEIPEHGGTSP